MRLRHYASSATATTSSSTVSPYPPVLYPLFQMLVFTMCCCLFPIHPMPLFDQLVSSPVPQGVLDITLWYVYRTEKGNGMKQTAENENKVRPAPVCLHPILCRHLTEAHLLCAVLVLLSLSTLIQRPGSQKMPCHATLNIQKQKGSQMGNDEKKGNG